MGISQSPFCVEPLEHRALLSVSVGSDGVTKITPSSDTRIVYVSSSAGSDSNSGLSSSSPVKSFNKAKSLVRDGKPDWMLLKAGDTFSGGLGAWKTSGRSSQEMQLIGSYGSGAKPVLKTGTTEGLVTYGGNGHSVDNVAVKGLSFIASSYNGRNGGFSTTGIRLTRQGTNWLVEDCRVEGYKDNISLDADGNGVNGFKLRRSQILNAYATSKVGNGHAQGIYIAGGTKNTTLELNTFDHNGWNSSVSGAGATMFNHNIYINVGVSGTVIRKNIISRASLTGITIRSGGLIQDNLIVKCPVGIKPGGSGTTITGNVILDGTDLAGTSGGAAGIDVTALSGITISNNIIAHEQSSGKYHVTGIRLNHGVKNATLSNNIIYDWQQAINNDGDSGITIKGNQLSALNSNAPLIAQDGAASPSKYHYSSNIYSTPRKGVNQISLSDKTLSAWVSATKETGAQAQKLSYFDPARSLSGSFSSFISGLGSKASSSLSSALSMISYIRAGFKKV